jgi:methylaspartate ammonia-lyase
MKIKHVLLGGGLTGFYTDDKLAILKDAPMDGFVYRGTPLTPGFKQIRQPGESVLVALVMDTGEVALGDCAGTQYSGSGGRDAPFAHATAIPLIQQHVVPHLIGREIDAFVPASKEIDQIEVNGGRLHPAIRYGVTQALLDAVAIKRRITKAGVVAGEYGTTVADKPIRIYAQCGDDRYNNVDKMIIKRVDIIPHGLINNVRDKVGANGEKFLDYVTWVRKRVQEIGDADYVPELHFDTYGTIGYAFDNNLEKVADYLARCAEAAAPFNFIIEMPVDLGSKAAQLEGMAKLNRLLRAKGAKVDLMIDEWCNSFDDLKDWIDSKSIQRINVKTITLGGLHNIVDAILYCNRNGVGAMVGGTCNETDISAMQMANLAMATSPQSIAGRPGMGVDEGVMTIFNEMVRVGMLEKLRRTTKR